MSTQTNDASKDVVPQDAVPVPAEPVKQQNPTTNLPPASQTIVPPATTTTTPPKPAINIAKPSDSTVTAPVNGGSTSSSPSPITCLPPPHT